MAKAERFTTPVGEAVFPRLNEPDTKFKAEGEFSVKLRLSGEAAAKLQDDLTARYDAFYASECKAKNKKSLKKANDLPFKPVKDDDDNETGDIEFKFSMKHNVAPKNGKPFQQQPALFDAKMKPVTATIWGGSKLKVSYEINLWNTALGVGMSLRLKAVQVLELVSGSGGNAASYGFGEEEGYEAEEKAEADTSGDNTTDTTDDGSADF